MFKHVSSNVDKEMCASVYFLNKSGYIKPKTARSYYNYVLCGFNRNIMKENDLNTDNEPSILGFILFLLGTSQLRDETVPPFSVACLKGLFRSKQLNRPTW